MNIERITKHIVVWYGYDRREYFPVVLDANISYEDKQTIINSKYIDNWGKERRTSHFEKTFIHEFNTLEEAIIDVGSIGWRKMQQKEEEDIAIQEEKFRD